jgi:hypothetical protein
LPASRSAIAAMMARRYSAALIRAAAQRGDETARYYHAADALG